MTTPSLRRVLRASYDEVLASLPAALATEGFGVLTEIDVRKTLADKLGVDFRRYRIVGACNPSFAHRALQHELEVGLLLPCNVVVYEADDGATVVSAVDPTISLGDRHPGLTPLAEDVRAKLGRALLQLPG